jgi:hypothetical protein
MREHHVTNTLWCDCAANILDWVHNTVLKRFSGRGDVTGAQPADWAPQVLDLNVSNN